VRGPAQLMITLWLSMVLASMPLYIGVLATPKISIVGATSYAVVLRSNASSAVVGETIELFGTVSPFEEGQIVHVYVDKGNGWEELASGSTSNGSFTFPYKADSRGKCRFRAVVISQGVVYASVVVAIEFWPGSVFARLLLEDANAGSLSRLRLFRDSLRNGSPPDRGIYSAFEFVSSGLGFLADSPLWSVFRIGLYPALWLFELSAVVYTATGISSLSLTLFSLLFGLEYLTFPVFIIGYFSKTGLTPIRWKRIFGIPTILSILSLLSLGLSPSPEVGKVAAIFAFASTVPLPGVILAKLINL
jgi:hypothetical protein